MFNIVFSSFPWLSYCESVVCKGFGQYLSCSVYLLPVITAKVGQHRGGGDTDM